MDIRKFVLTMREKDNCTNKKVKVTVKSASLSLNGTVN